MSEGGLCYGAINSSGYYISGELEGVGCVCVCVCLCLRSLFGHLWLWDSCRIRGHKGRGSSGFECPCVCVYYVMQGHVIGLEWLWRDVCMCGGA